MLHIGVVFVVFGVFLMGAGLIPDDATAMNAWSIFAKDSWWNELVLTGLFAMGLGIFLIILNSVISKKEDDDLEAYVQSQLTRSRSGKFPSFSDVERQSFDNRFDSCLPQAID